MKTRRIQLYCSECLAEIWMPKSDLFDGKDTEVRCADCCKKELTSTEYETQKKSQARPLARQRQLERIWASKKAGN